MLIAVLVVGAGLLIVGFGQRTWRNLIAAGAFTGVGVAAMHYTGMAAMHVFALGPGGGMNMAGNGATAESFLLPLVIGISILAFILTATLALSPTDEEMREDAELMQRIQGGTIRASTDGRPLAPSAPAPSGQHHPGQVISRAAQARRQADRNGDPFYSG